MKMKKKVLSAAVVAAMGVGSAQAVNLGQNGLGEVGIVPYYTVRGDNETLLSVTNTTDQYKAIKIRFREAWNSREVYDFNLFLSPKDVWTVKVTQNAAGNAALELSSDTSCTAPDLTTLDPSLLSFIDFEYSGLDDGPNDLDRVNEGYIEVIEMAEALNAGGFIGLKNDSYLGTWWDQDGDGVNDANHGTDGKPDNCAGFTEAFAQGWDEAGLDATMDYNRDLAEPTGGLKVEANIINVVDGYEFAVPVTHLEAWSNITRFYGTGTLNPRLSQATPAASVVMLNDNWDQQPTVYVDNWDADGVAPSTTLEGAAAVSAPLMVTNVINSFTANPAVEGGTDIVVTFPTKSFFVDEREVVAPVAPFTNLFTIADDAADSDADGYGDPNEHACEATRTRVWSREEQTFDQGILPSPYPPEAGVELCFEANVLSMGSSSDVMNSVSPIHQTLSTNNFANGWVDINLDTEGHEMVAPSGNAYQGLPAISFRASVIKRGSAAANYATSVPASYNRAITGVAGDLPFPSYDPIAMGDLPSTSAM